MEEQLPQPQDIPWKLLCTSNDMMDPTWCNKKFPMPWKSSVAISAYEPKEEDLPTPFCAGRLTYLKVSGTINDALSDTLEQFIIKTKLSYQDAVDQRRLIGLQIRHES